MATSKRPTRSLALGKLEEQITCPICLGFYNDPRTLPCLHSFCRDCLERIPSHKPGGTIKCPTCRTSIKMAEFPVAFQINSLKDLYEVFEKVAANQLPCQNCEETDPAVTYCLDCSQFMCKGCTETHMKWLKFRNHQIKTINELSLSSSPSAMFNASGTYSSNVDSCSEHDRPLEIFCETCDKVICQHCTVKIHRDHEYDLISAICKQQSSDMRGKMEPLTDKITAAQQLVYAYKDKEKTIGNTRRNVKEKINTFVLELINQLNQTKEKLHREIDTSADKALLDCSKRRHIVEQSLTNMTQCKDYVEHSLSQLGTSYDEVVLKSLKQMNNRMSVVTGELNTEDFNVASDGSFRLDFVKSSVKFDNIGRLASSSDIKKDPPLRFPTLYSQDVLSTEYKVKEIDQKQVVIKAGVVKFPLKLIPPSILSPFVPVALLSCQMRVAESGEEIKTVVASADDLNTYNVECYPTRNGLHNLKVKIQHRILNEVTLRVPINPSLKHTRPTSIFSDLRSPYSVAVADNNLVLVADCGMNTIAVLKDGTRYTTLGRNIGTGNAKFENPRGVAVSKDNFVLVTDNHRLQKVNWDGKLMASVGNHGNGNLEFSTPCGMAVSPVSGKIYIVESSNHRVQVLNDDLTFSFMFGSSGTGNGQFLRPRDITMDTQGNLYVSDAGNNRIQKFTSQGRFVCQIGRAGTCPGQLSRPHGVAVDSSNFLYVAEVANHRVSIFKTSGDFFGCFGEEGSDNYQFKGSGGIDFSKDGQLFICDFYNKRVVAY